MRLRLGAINESDFFTWDFLPVKAYSSFLLLPWFSYPLILKKLFVRLRDCIVTSERNGIYKLEGGDCDATYNSETSRQLKPTADKHIAHWASRYSRTTYYSLVISSKKNPSTSSIKSLLFIDAWHWNISSKSFVMAVIMMRFL